MSGTWVISFGYTMFSSSVESTRTAHAVRVRHVVWASYLPHEMPTFIFWFLEAMLVMPTSPFSGSSVPDTTTAEST